MFEEDIIGAHSWFIGLTDQGHEGRYVEIIQYFYNYKVGDLHLDRHQS